MQYFLLHLFGVIPVMLHPTTKPRPHNKRREKLICIEKSWDIGFRYNMKHQACAAVARLSTRNCRKLAFSPLVTDEIFKDGKFAPVFMSKKSNYDHS